MSSIHTSSVISTGPARPAAPMAGSLLLAEEEEGLPAFCDSNFQPNSYYDLQQQLLQQQQQQQYKLVDERRLSFTSSTTSGTVRTCSTCSTSASSSSSRSSSSDSSVSSQGEGRAVQFALHATALHIFERPFHEQDKPLLWYSKDAIQAAVRQERDFVADYTTSSREGTEYLTQLLQIWTTPCSQTSVLQTLVHPICNSPVRGLEKHCLKSMKQRRGIVLRKVLQAQLRLAATVTSPEERDLLLREECEPLSRTSARFAMALALGDAMAASTF